MITPVLYLEFCSAKHPTYLDIRSRHYVPVKGTHGQQVHFLIWYKGSVVGIISGASAVFATAARDKFFGINKDNRTLVLNDIVDNVVFRLENHEKNLASRVLSLWKKSVAFAWEFLYDVKVFGYETFILREGLMREILTGKVDALGRPEREVITVDDPELNVRRGNLYKATNWEYVGETSGSGKGRDGVGLTGGIEGGKGYFLRKKVPIKCVYCKWVPGIVKAIEQAYLSSWKASTTVGTVDEKSLAKDRAARRAGLLGTVFYMENNELIHEDFKQATRRRIEWSAPRTARKTRSSTVPRLAPLPRAVAILASLVD